MPPGRKEAADKSLLVDMMLFALDNPAPAVIVCVTGDMDFAPCLSKLKQRKYKIVLVHPGSEKRVVSENLIKAASEQYGWESVLSGNPVNAPLKAATGSPSPQRNDPKGARTKAKGKGKGRGRGGRSRSKARGKAQINASFLDPFAAKVIAAIDAEGAHRGLAFREALNIHRRCYQEDGREWPSVVKLVAEMEKKRWIVIEGEKPNQILKRGSASFEPASSRSTSRSSSKRRSGSDSDSAYSRSGSRSGSRSRSRSRSISSDES